MLHIEAVKPATLGLLNEIVLFPELNNFFLVGGTALALQIGHRLSIDLDFFTNYDFDIEIIEELLQNKYQNCKTLVKVANSTLIMSINEIKVDFIKYRYPIIDEILVHDNIKMFGKKDIAAMKLSAISQRGEKKDFYDLYYLLNDYSFNEMLLFFSMKYKQTELIHIIKSITYFDDADTSFEVQSLKSLNWDKVKNKISTEARKIS